MPDLTGVVVVLAVVLVLGLLGWYLSYSAARLDRLHHRVEGARAALETQLVRRAGAASDLATSGLLDPASALVLASAAGEAAAPGEVEESAQNDLSRALVVALPGDQVSSLREHPVGHDLVAALADACHRAQLARRFLNDAVAQAGRVRRKRVVRWARLAGRAPAPQTVEIDDDPPEPLRR